MCQPKIIALWGTASKGKTQTLNLVINKLCCNYGADVVSGNFFGNIKNDSCLVVDYQGKKIGIITNGDNDEVLSKGFEKLPDDCDLYICASRTKGSSCKSIRNKKSNIVWVEKWCITTENCKLNNIEFLQRKANDIQATGIIEIIREILF